MVRRRHVSPANSMTRVRKPTLKPVNRRKKNKLFAGLGSVRIVKNCDLGLENAALTFGLGQHFQDLGHSFSLYGPPSRQITYIYWLAGMNDILYEQRLNVRIGVKSIEQSVRNLVPRIFSWKRGWSARAKPLRRISAAKKMFHNP